MKALKVFFIFNLIVMLAITTWASLDSSVMTGLDYLFKNAWGIATLCDTYFSFTIIYIWMAYKEPSWMKRILWLLAVYALGSIAVAVFVLHELSTLPSFSVEAFLVRRPKNLGVKSV